MMSELNQNLRRKAFGIMKSIEAMNDKERSTSPSESYGKNFNILRELCCNENPTIKELMPPAVTFADYGSNNYVRMVTEHRFSEIHTFCSEIYHLLEENISISE